jgi:Na+-driven multidrug efflux pump
MAAFADFGVGNGVLNTVARAVGKNDMAGVRKAVSSGFAVLTSIAVLLMLSFFTLFLWLRGFFRVLSPQARREIGPAHAYQEVNRQLLHRLLGSIIGELKLMTQVSPIKSR